jgi:ElaB/YqjD/DUF883 family membrane-anchored ribosome-binding protein
MSDAADEPPTSAAPDQPKSAEQIRAEIEATQEQLGETVEALASKTDVKARAQDRVESVKENAQQRVESAKASAAQLKDEVVSKARQATPESAEAGAHQVSAAVRERPLPYATVAAFGAGLLLGWLLGRR